MNHPRSLWRLRPLPDTPLPHLIRPRRKKADKSQRAPHRDDNLPDGTLDTKLLALLCCLLIRHARETLLEGYREGDDHVAGTVLVDPGFDLREVFVLLPDVVFFREVDEEDYGLGGEEHEGVDYFDLWG